MSISPPLAKQGRRQVRPPSVTKVEVKNFRLLRDVSVTFDSDVTVCVGRNNTGKTSLAEILSRFLRPADISLRLEDFSADSYVEFADAYRAFSTEDEEAAREIIPEISVTVFIRYDHETSDYGPIGPLIVDLDPECNEAIVTIRYALKPGTMKEFFRDVSGDLVEGWEESLLLTLVGPRIPHFYERTAVAVDPSDPTNSRTIPLADVARAIRVDFVKAQRGLDDEKERPKDQIGKVLESLFMVAAKADDGTILKTFANDTESALADIVTKLNGYLHDIYSKMAPTVADFGYPGLGSRNFSTRTTLDSRRLLSNFTSIKYPGSAGVELPESYSGLGSRNLLMILLTLFSYYREYSAQGSSSSIHLVFVEEPEAHLHPQMQETFIHQLGIFKKKFPSTNESQQVWNAQFLVTTHSAHIANRAGFSAIRYFRLCEDEDPTDATSSEVLNLAEAPGIDKEFLHKYLTLTRADLFFADKAILIEGSTERIFLPAAIAVFDEQAGTKVGGSLSSQYVSIMEVGGAHAHIFYPFLDFLGLQTLIITDLDSAKRDSKNQLEGCCVHEGTATTNEGIKKWFGEKNLLPAELLERAESALPVIGVRGLAYQVPENSNDPCGRTFEDAFILANPALFDMKYCDEESLLEREQKARELAKKHKKSDFGLMLAIEKDGWKIPLYIRRGLDWLLDRETVDTNKGAGQTESDPSPGGQVTVG
ncbi:ATP-dependent nuclease [Streptomyces goshikiensis]|uniref:ATP-dependent nuclease n=1 Tax=Streptomyces goshikiensis TaxID=1942 RepID=UPI0037920FED